MKCMELIWTDEKIDITYTSSEIIKSVTYVENLMLDEAHTDFDIDEKNYGKQSALWPSDTYMP